MTDFSITVEIAASPALVWNVLKDVEHWHEWTASVISIERLDAGPLKVGSRARVRQPKLRPAVYQVTEMDESRGFTWIAQNPGLRVIARHDIEPGAKGTRVTLSVELTGLLAPLVRRLYRDLNQRYVTMEANGLKARCEAV